MGRRSIPNSDGRKQRAKQAKIKHRFHNLAKKRESEQLAKEREQLKNLDVDIESMPTLIANISRMQLIDMPALMKRFFLESAITLQHGLIEACLKRILCILTGLDDISPYEEQVHVLRRLIFGLGDTLLIARTGFGKSLILQAYTILTGKATIQIVPLDRLGSQQLYDLQQLRGTNACFINDDTVKNGIYQRIQKDNFTHILLGPEQAASPTFLKLISSPSMQEKIGLVAIDECHLIHQWSTFRPEFEQLGQLRGALRRDIVWFGCSGTLSEEAQKVILDKGGFRTIGENTHQTQIVRVSVDRADMFLSLHPILPGNMQNWRQLYFLLENAVKEGIANPKEIKKTVIFVDSINKVLAGARCLQSFLLQKNSHITNGGVFNRDPNSPLSVESIVHHYHSRVSKGDKEQRFNEFKKADSNIRIMFATTSLGMGINISDIERVVQWNWPKDKDICDLWQRLGRGGRGRGRTSIGYWFIPYWAFDSQCRPLKSKDQPKKQKKKSKQIQTSYNSQPQPSSQLSQSFTPDELNESELDDSELDEHMNASQDTFQNASQSASQDDSQCVPVAVGAVIDFLLSGGDGWNEKERKQRQKLSTVLQSIINGQCHRKGFLCYLGEDLLPHGAERIPVLPENCCNGTGCNPNQDQDMPLAPAPPKPAKAPRKNSRADMALKCIDKWLTERAMAEYTTQDCRFPMSADIILEEVLRWRLAREFTKARDKIRDKDKDKEKINEKLLTFDSLAMKIVELETWKHREKLGASLVQYLLDQYNDIQKAAQRTNSDDSKNLTSIDSDDDIDLTPLTPSEAYKMNIRKQNDKICKRAVINHATQAEEKRRHLNNNPQTPLISQSSDILSVDSIFNTDDFTSSIEISPLRPRVQSPDQSPLQSRARSEDKSPTQSPTRSLGLGQQRVMTPVQSPAKRKRTEEPETSTSPRRPLGALDANVIPVSGQLTWSPKSQRGRARTQNRDFQYLYKD